MLECDRGENRVHNERARGLAGVYDAAQYVRVLRAWLKDSCRRLSKPRRNRRFGLRSRKRTFERSVVRGYPEEGPKSQPSEAHEVGPGEHRLQPSSALVVLRGSRVIGIE